MRERQVENDIVSALENGELQLYVQPKVDMRDGRVIGGEALVRWKHPEKGLVPPREFIPVLEKNGFIINVDEYIWEKVFAYLGKLHREDRMLVPVSINVSRLHAYDEKMAEVIAKYHAACCLMHNREKAEYEEFQKDFIEDMKECVRLAKEAGIADEKIILDPGVGFGKTYEMLSLIHI